MSEGAHAAIQAAMVLLIGMLGLYVSCLILVAAVRLVLGAYK